MSLNPRHSNQPVRFTHQHYSGIISIFCNTYELRVRVHVYCNTSINRRYCILRYCNMAYLGSMLLYTASPLYTAHTRNGFTFGSFINGPYAIPTQYSSTLPTRVGTRVAATREAGLASTKACYCNIESRYCGTVL